ncbi:hypothetical protein ACFE04_025862 [Oxalis oulophora]
MAKPRTPKNSITTTTTMKKTQPKPQPPSWAIIRGIFSSKQQQQQQQPTKEQKHNTNMSEETKSNKKTKQKHQKEQTSIEETSKRSSKKMKCSGSICSNTKVMHRPEISPNKKRGSDNSSVNDSSSRSMKAPLNEINGVNVNVVVSNTTVSSSSSVNGSFRGMPFRRFSGCYECRMVVDPVLGIARDPSLRSSICSCPDCGEIFTKTENLELHQATRHAVSELGPEDTSKNIVEIIFQSSWLKKEIPVCKIDRILKVHNTPKTISKFEEYRDSIKVKANKLPKKHPRCIADGNELLRFHCTSFACSLGLNGSTNLCNTIPHCNVCSMIKNGFKITQDTTGDNVRGILTTATSGKAHDKACCVEDGNDRRAMLVCRVIAGRVKKSNVESNGGEYDSVGGGMGLYSNLDELYVFNPKAILPCFVVIYRGF